MSGKLLALYAIVTYLVRVGSYCNYFCTWWLFWFLFFFSARRVCIPLHYATQNKTRSIKLFSSFKRKFTMLYYLCKRENQSNWQENHKMLVTQVDLPVVLERPSSDLETWTHFKGQIWEKGTWTLHFNCIYLSKKEHKNERPIKALWAIITLCYYC